MPRDDRDHDNTRARLAARRARWPSTDGLDTNDGGVTQAITLDPESAKALAAWILGQCLK